VDLRAGLDTMKNKIISYFYWASNPESSVVRLSLPPASADLLRRLRINPEQGSGTFTRNVGLPLNYEYIAIGRRIPFTAVIIPG
jgi:hypothetical protein